MSEVGTAKHFGIGAIFMALAGAGTVIYAFVAGEPTQGNVEAQARLLITVVAILFVPMGVIVGVMLYRQSKK